MCSADHREDNDLTLGVDPCNREGLQIDYVLNQKDNKPQCKKHKSETWVGACGDNAGLSRAGAPIASASRRRS
jgi:hypothetical protein